MSEVSHGCFFFLAPGICAKITSQQGVYLYDLISQIPGAQKETAMGDFAQMRQALEAGVIDAYVSERPEALTAESANAKFKMIQPEPKFKTGEEDTSYRYRSS